MTQIIQVEAPVQAEAISEEPQSSSERYMASLWSEIIGLAKVSPSDKFLEVGGNSLTLNIVISRIKSEWGVSIEAQLFFDPDKSSVRDLAAELDALLANPDRSEKVALGTECL